MNSYFTVKVKYTKQLSDGTFKRVTESYLVAAMSFTDAESRIYEELGSLIRGEFMVTGIVRADFHDIFHYEDVDVWYKCKITYESGGDGLDEGAKSKKVSQNFLVTAHSVKDASERLKESLGGMMIDYVIKSVVESPIVDVFPFSDANEDSEFPFIFPKNDITEGTIVDFKFNGELFMNYEYEGGNVFLSVDYDSSFIYESGQLMFRKR